MMEFLATIQTPLLVIHALTAVFLVTVIMLQAGKGADIGAMMGAAASSQSFFGARGASNFLTKLTTYGAVFFLVTSLALASSANHESKGQAGASAVEKLLDQPVVPETPKADVSAKPADTTPAPKAAESDGQNH